MVAVFKNLINKTRKSWKFFEGLWSLPAGLPLKSMVLFLVLVSIPNEFWNLFDNLDFFSEPSKVVVSIDIDKYLKVLFENGLIALLVLNIGFVCLILSLPFLPLVAALNIFFGINIGFLPCLIVLFPFASFLIHSIAKLENNKRLDWIFACLVTFLHFCITLLTYNIDISDDPQGGIGIALLNGLSITVVIVLCYFYRGYKWLTKKIIA